MEPVQKLKPPNSSPVSVGSSRGQGRNGRGPGACASRAQTPIFDGTSCAVFRSQFETVAEHNHWSPQKKSAYLITALRGREVLYGIPTNPTDGKTLQALEDCFGAQHFAAADRCQLTTRTQRAGESLRDFTTAVQQLEHLAYMEHGER